MIASPTKLWIALQSSIPLDTPTFEVTSKRISNFGTYSAFNSPVAINALPELLPYLYLARHCENYLSLGCNSLMMKFFEQDIKNKNFSSPIEKASFIHCQVVHMHPFVGGNGRTARLLLNLSLNEDNCPMILIEYYLKAIRDYCDTFNINNFEKFIEKNLDKQLDLFIKDYSHYVAI